MGNFIDLTNERFGKLKVVRKAEKHEIKSDAMRKKVCWVCICDCGNKIIADGGNLRAGHKKSCGCLKREIYDGSDEVGNRYGEWEVLRKATPDEKPSKTTTRAFFWCRCSCGTVKCLNIQSLHRGYSTSCGCKQKGDVIDETDNIYGEWHVIKRATSEEIKEYGPPCADIRAAWWWCECSCGESIQIIKGHSLRNGSTKSCGHTRLIDETDKVYGEWKVIRRARPDEVTDITDYTRRSGFWLCKCSCGKIKAVHGTKLRDGRSRSCGHVKEVDESNNVYGEWKVIRKATYQEKMNHGLNPVGIHWLCECSCGVRKIIAGNSLRNGTTLSCGHNLGKQRPLDADRNEQQIALMEDNNLLKEKLKEYKIKNGMKPSSNYVMRLLGCSTTTSALAYIRKHGLMDYVQLSETGTSGIEKEIAVELSLNADNTLLRNKNILNGLEIDLFIPKDRLGIEINGDYWHSELYKDKQYHKNKTKLALSKNIRLIHIFENELRDRNKHDIIINMLKAKIYDGCIIDKKECKVRVLSVTEAKQFNEKYSLYGHIDAYRTVGIEKDGSILALMSIGFANGREYDWEIVQYTKIFGLEVEDGAEVMLNELRNKCKGSIYVEVDASKFTGAIYKSLGFKVIDWSEPEYHWYNVIEHKVIKKNTISKQILLAKGYGKPEQDFEYIMDSIGYVKVYDCGVYKLVLE